MNQFSTGYWEDHWKKSLAHQAPSGSQPAPPNPHLIRHTGHLTPTSALDAGCGTGIEALWLAEQGWAVTGADTSGTALAAAQRRHAENPPTHAVEWVKTDVARWSPERTWDLVVTHYAHPDTSQLTFYQHIARFVAPGGTLLIVAHGPHSARHRKHAVAMHCMEVTRRFAGPEWVVEHSQLSTRQRHKSATCQPDRHTANNHVQDAVMRFRRLA